MAAESLVRVDTHGGTVVTFHLDRYSKSSIDICSKTIPNWEKCI